jgi:hypothetical protein
VDELQTKLPQTLQAERVLLVRAELGERMELGPSKHGARFVVPILGGRFSGTPAGLQGEVLSGGADWQLLRPDGVLELDARYTLRVADGTLLHVRNRGLVVLPAAPEPDQKPGAVYVRTVPELEAPLASAHAWLNRTLFIGTLELSARNTVLVAMYRVV